MPQTHSWRRTLRYTLGHTLKYTLGLALITLIVGTSPAAADKKDRHQKYHHHHREDTIVRMEKCLFAARHHVPGKVRTIEFEVEKGIPYYEFEIVTAKNHVYDVECNALTGMIDSVERETRSADQVFRQMAKISLDQAKKIAIQTHPGTVIDQEMAIDDMGRAIYEFEIDTEHGGIVEVEIDAENGTIVEIDRRHYAIGA